MIGRLSASNRAAAERSGELIREPRMCAGKGSSEALTAGIMIAYGEMEYNVCIMYVMCIEVHHHLHLPYSFFLVVALLKISHVLYSRCPFKGVI